MQSRAPKDNRGDPGDDEGHAEAFAVDNSGDPARGLRPSVAVPAAETPKTAKRLTHTDERSDQSPGQPQINSKEVKTDGKRNRQLGIQQRGAATVDQNKVFDVDNRGEEPDHDLVNLRDSLYVDIVVPSAGQGQGEPTASNQANLNPAVTGIAIRAHVTKSASRKGQSTLDGAQIPPQDQYPQTQYFVPNQQTGPGSREGAGGRAIGGDGDWGSSPASSGQASPRRPSSRSRYPRENSQRHKNSRAAATAHVSTGPAPSGNRYPRDGPALDPDGGMQRQSKQFRTIQAPERQNNQPDMTGNQHMLHTMLEEEKALAMADRFGRVPRSSPQSGVPGEGVQSGANASMHRVLSVDAREPVSRPESEIYEDLRRAHTSQFEEPEDQFLLTQADMVKKDLVDVVIPDAVPQLQAQGKRLQKFDKNYQQFNEVGLRNSFLSGESQRRARQQSQSLAATAQNPWNPLASRQKHRQPPRRNIGSQIHSNNMMLSPTNMNNNLRSPPQGIISEDVSGFQIQGRSALSGAKGHDGLVNHPVLKHEAALQMRNTRHREEGPGAARYDEAGNSTHSGAKAKNMSLSNRSLQANNFVVEQTTAGKNFVKVYKRSTGRGGAEVQRSITEGNREAGHVETSLLPLHSNESEAHKKMMLSYDGTRKYDDRDASETRAQIGGGSNKVLAQQHQPKNGRNDAQIDGSSSKVGQKMLPPNAGESGPSEIASVFNRQKMKPSVSLNKKRLKNSNIGSIDTSPGEEKLHREQIRAFDSSQRTKEDKSASKELSSSKPAHPKLMGQKEIAQNEIELDHLQKNRTTDAASTDFGGIKNSYLPGAGDGLLDLQENQLEHLEQFASSRYEIIQAKRQQFLKGSQDKFAGQVGTQRDYRNQENLLRDQDVEKLGVLSSVETFRNPASASDHVNSNTLNRSQIQSPETQTLSIWSPRSGQRQQGTGDHGPRRGGFEPAHRIIHNTFISPKNSRHKGNNGGPRQAVAMPKFFKKHLIEQKVYTQQFVNTQRHDLRDRAERSILEVRHEAPDTRHQQLLPSATPDQHELQLEDTTSSGKAEVAKLAACQGRLATQQQARLKPTDGLGSKPLQFPRKLATSIDPKLEGKKKASNFEQKQRKDQEGGPLHITDFLNHQTGDQRKNLRKQNPLPLNDRILSARDIQDVVSASGSYQKIQAEMEMIEDYRKNPFYSLEPDEEFIIKNYRLIRKKREADLGLSEDLKEKQTCGGHTGHAANGRVQSPDGRVQAGSPQRPSALAGLRSTPESAIQAASEENTATAHEKALALRPCQRLWESKIRVSNSVISPHTFNFSTHISKTSNMHWEKVAQLRLGGIDQDTFIGTLDGRSRPRRGQEHDYRPSETVISGEGAPRLAEELRRRDKAQEAEVAAARTYRQQEYEGVEQLNQNKMAFVQTQSQGEIEKPLENSTQRSMVGRGPNLAHSTEARTDGDIEKGSDQDVPEGNLLHCPGGQGETQDERDTVGHVSCDTTQQEFQRRCLDFWMMGAEDEKKHRKEGAFLDLDQQYELHHGTKASFQEIFNRKSNETISVQKRAFESGKAGEKLDKKNAKHKIAQGKTRTLLPQHSEQTVSGKEQSSRAGTRDGLQTQRLEEAKETERHDAGAGASATSTAELGPRPYDHLRARNVFREQGIQFTLQMKSLEAVEDTHERVNKMIELTKTFPTALDKKKGIAELMPFELFIEDYLSETAGIAAQIKRRKRKGKPPLRAKSHFYHLDGSVEDLFVNVVEYDENLKKFFVEYEIPEGSPTRKDSGSNIVRKQSGRLNLLFEWELDGEQRLKQRFQNAQNRRKAALALLAEERMILNDMIYKYQDIFMPIKFKMQIRKRVNARIGITSYPRQEILQNLIMQVEALYVYSILKSVIRSQRDDMLIRKLMSKHGLKSLDPPLVDHDGTMFSKYEMLPFSAERREDRDNSIKMIKGMEGQTVPGNKHLIEVVRFAMNRTQVIISAHPLFELPTELNDETLGYLLSQKEFAANTRKTMREKLAKYPVQMNNIVQIQDVLTKRFRDLLRSGWLEKIVQKVEAAISVVFKDADEVKPKTKRKGKVIKSTSQINPYLMRFFTFMNIYLERMLLDKMKESMEKYLRFLLQFMARTSNFTEKEEFKQIGLDEITVRIQNSPMTEIEVRVSKRKVENGIKDQGRPESPGGTAGKQDGGIKGRKVLHRSNTATKAATAEGQGNPYEIVTNPDIQKSWKKLTDIIEDFRLALAGVQRIETIIYPLLEDTRRHLGNPDPSEIEDLKILNMQIKWLISQAKGQPEAIIKRLSRHLKYVACTYDQMMIELKTRILHEKAKDEEADSRASGSKQQLVQLDDSDDGEGRQSGSRTPRATLAERLADTEISPQDYAEKFNELRQAYWHVQLQFDDQYDFGLIFLDLRPIKKQISTKIQALIQKLSAEVTHNFTERMDELHSKFAEIESKITTSHDQIDAVIQQIEYIKRLTRKEQIIDDLEAEFGELQTEKDFIDDVGLKLPSEEFMKYLSLYLYPNLLRATLKEKAQDIVTQKRRLDKMLQADIDSIQVQIEKCQAVVDAFKDKGLQTKEELEEEASRENAPAALVKAIKEIEKSGQPPLIREYISKNHDTLVAVGEDCQGVCDMIDRLHKRQRQLGAAPTLFPALDTAEKELEPFLKLWEVSSLYAEKRTGWWSGKLNSINSDRMQDSVAKWQKTLNNLKKVANISVPPGPSRLRQLIFDELDSLKKYLPIITSLRTKGLEKRHFQEMSQKLGVNIDPAQLTLTQLRKEGLAQGQALEAIRGVSEVAFKENAIKVAIEAAEKDLREIGFEYTQYKDTKVRIIKNPEGVLQSFEDCLMKIQSLKGNQYAQHVGDRIAKNERDLQYLQAHFEDWVKVQKSWVYLEPIYTQDDVTTVLVEQKKVFDDLNAMFKKIMRGGTGMTSATVQEFCRDGVVNVVAEMLRDIEYLDKSLNDYLDSKRTEFARLYFTSNEELIGLMGNLNNQSYLQVFLSKLFEGIAGLVFENEDIVGFYSLSRETLYFQEPISTVVPPEMWLKEVEMGMKLTIYQTLEEAVADCAALSALGRLGDWMVKWPGQITVLVMHIMHNNNMEKFFDLRNRERGPAEAPFTLETMHSEVLDQINLASELTRTKLESNARVSVHNFIVNRIHTRDSLNEMRSERDQLAQEDFYWKIQTKYHYILHQRRPPTTDGTPPRKPPSQIVKERDELKKFKALGMPDAWHHHKAIKHDWLPGNAAEAADAIRAAKRAGSTLAVDASDQPEPPPKKSGTLAELSISCIMARLPFGYEYIGNQERLVITPLTDRCFRAIFMAIQYSHGAAVEGPVGTGKTETTKEIAKSAGKMCFVFNCSSALQFDSLLKFFKGCIGGGSWSCFDEFNRIDREVLSIVSQTIMTINQALREQRREIVLSEDDKPMPFNDSCAIFITMNPAGGKEGLPDNLKHQFRPVQMTKPDLQIITEVILFCNGFQNSSELSNKIVKTFQLAQIQLGSCIHYDFGLRSMKGALEQAGVLKQLTMGVIDPQREEMQRAEAQVDQHLQALERTHAKVQDSAIRESAMNLLKAKESLGRKAPPTQKRSSFRGLPLESEGPGTSFNAAGDNVEDDGENREGSRQGSKLHGRTRPASVRSGTEQKGELEELVADSQQEECEDDSSASGHEDDPGNGELQVSKSELERCQTWLGVTDPQLVSTYEKVEEYIILKAIFDQNLSKLQGSDQAIFKGITGDIFKQTKVETKQGGSFEEDVLQIMAQYGLQAEEGFVTSVLSLGEVISNRHGIMVIGEPMVGKTQALRLLQDTYNMLQKQEYLQRHKEFVRRKVQAVEGGDPAGTKEHSRLTLEHSLSRELSGSAFDVTAAEGSMIKQACKQKSVTSSVINPKAQRICKLMGEVDRETREFKEGILSTTMRQAIRQKDGRHTWITFDGDIEMDWVENLNSVLDDNRKLTLITGESLPLTKQMRIIIESNNLNHCSPATISRCGIIYIPPKQVSSKSVFNHFMRNFPPILSDLVQKFDQLVNYFFPDILEKFLWVDSADSLDSPSEGNSNIQHMLYPLTEKNAVQNFLKFFEACIGDFRHQKFKEWRIVQRSQAGTRTVEDYTDGTGTERSHTRGSSVQPAGGANTRKQSYFKFADSDARMESALRCREQWLECFFVQSLIWAFASLFKEGQRKRFAEHVKEKILKNLDHATPQSTARGDPQPSPTRQQASASSPEIIPKEPTTPGMPPGARLGDNSQAIVNAYTSQHLIAGQAKGASRSPSRSRAGSAAGSRAPVISESKFRELTEQRVKYVPTESFVQRMGGGAKGQEDELDLEGAAELMLLIQENDSPGLGKPGKSKMSVGGSQGDAPENVARPTSKGSQKQTPSGGQAPPPDHPSSAAQERQRSASYIKLPPATTHLDAPTFRWQLPQGPETNLLDIYFDIETNRWESWDFLHNRSASHLLSRDDDSMQTLGPAAGAGAVDRKAALFAEFIPTIETTQLGFFIEGLLMERNNLALVGESGSGKTWLMNHVIFEQMKRFLSQLVIEPMVFYHNSSVDAVLKALESPLEKKRKGVFAPVYGKKVVYYIDDLTMCKKEHHWHKPRVEGRAPGFQPDVLELVRQHLDHKQWYDMQTLERKLVEDVQFAACITCNPSSPASALHLLHQRNQRHWVVVGQMCEKQHLEGVFGHIVRGFVLEWPKFYQNKYNQKIIDCTLKLAGCYAKLVKASTHKFLYTFNLRHLYRILHSMACFDAERKMSEFDICKLWVAEAYRTLLDRIREKEDRKIFCMEIDTLAKQHFTLIGGKQKLPRRPFFSHLCGSNIDDLSYQEVDKVRHLKPIVEAFIEEYNESNKSARFDTPMFDFMIEQVIKINRAIQQPFSSVILIGVEGLGKFALSRLALYICKYQRHEMSVLQPFDTDDWKQTLRDMVRSAAADGLVNVVNLQARQIAADPVLVDLNCLLKNGQLPDLLPGAELKSILARVRQTMQSDGELGDQQEQVVSSPFTQPYFSEYINRVKRNFKAVLNLTPSGTVLKHEMRGYQSIIDCSTLIWMDSWPEEGFRQVGQLQFELDSGHKSQAADSGRSQELAQKEELVKQALKMHSDAQRAVKQYAQETGHHLQVTPCAFINLIQTFKHIFKQRLEHYDALKLKYRAGLDQLQRTEGLVYAIQEQMQQKSPELVEKQRQIEDILRELDSTTNEMEQRVKFVEEEEMALEMTRTNAHKIRDQCERQFEEAIPLLKKAINGLKKLSKSEVGELKTIRRPSKAVYTLMQCVCIVMAVPPRKVKRPEELVKWDDDWWPPATGKEVLNDFRLVDRLSNYNPEDLNAEIMLKLEHAASDPDFTPTSIGKASKAAQGIYHWLMAIKNYYYVYAECKPKRDALFLAEKQILVHEEEVQHREGQRAKLQAKLSELRDAYKEKEASVRQLQAEIDECNIQKTRAAKLLNSLQGERQKWGVLNRVVLEKYDTLEGDCLLAAGLMIYLGQFTHSYREEYFYSWVDDAQENTDLRISNYYDFIKLFGDQIVIKKWVINKLPSDTFSISNALIIALSPIQSVAIDPQYQANLWLKEDSKDGAEESDLRLLTFHNPSFLRILSACMKFGKKALVENVGEDIDRALYPLFNKTMLRNDGGTQSIFLQGVAVPIDPNFKLYITTEVASPRFPPEVAVHANFINFSVTQEALETQLLSVIVAEKMAKLEKKFVEVKVKALSCITRLQTVEDLILEALGKDVDAVLNDDKLVEHLSQSNLSSKKVTKALQQIKKQEKQLRQDRNAFSPVAKRGAMLFFLIQDLTRLEHVYQFSLKWFMRLFDQELKSKDNVNSTLDPLVDLNNRLTRAIYQKLCVGVFQKDKLMIAFMTAFRLMQSEAQFDMDHMRFIIKGPFAPAIKEGMTQVEKDEVEFTRRKKRSQPHPKKLKLMSLWQGWMTEKHWEGLEILSRIPPFDKPNVIDHMIAHHADWARFINDMDDHANPVIPAPYSQFKTEAGSKALSPAEQIKERKRKEEQAREARGEVDVDRIFQADDSDRGSCSDDGDADGGDRKRSRKGAESPSLRERSDEDEEMFLRRRNYIEEDEYVSKKIISGLAEYNEFKIGSENVDEHGQTPQLRLNRELLRFCILRVFRPDLVVDQAKRFVELFLDPGYTATPAFSYGEIIKSTDHDVANLVVFGRNVDAQQEILRMRKVLKRDSPFRHKALNYNNLKDLPEFLAYAAQAGHWILLAGLHHVIDSLPELDQFLQHMFGYQKEQELEKERERKRAERLERGGGPGVFDDDVSESATERPHDGPNKSRRVGSKKEWTLKMPYIRDFYIATSFRLWVSTKAVDELPISVLQNCNKLVFEPVQGLKTTMAKIFSSTPHEYISALPDVVAPFRLLYFLLTFYHTVLNERKKFRSLGWSQAYDFTQDDSQLAAHAMLQVMKALKDQEPEPEPARVGDQLRLIKYLVGTSIYGGKITNEQDQLVADELLATVIHRTGVAGVPFNLTGLRNPKGDLAQYAVPTQGSCDHYIGHLGKFPPADRPDVCGIHSNAECAMIQQDGTSLMAKIFEFQFEYTNQAGPGARGGQDAFDRDSAATFKRYKMKLRDVEYKLPDLIDEELLDQKFEPSFEDSISIMMHQEVKRYNALIRELQKRVQAQIQCLEGGTIMDCDMEAQFRAIVCDKTPLSWLSLSYPASSILPNYLSNLQERVEYIGEVINQKKDGEDLHKFWLPGLFDQGSFFTMILQHETRRKGLSLGEASYEYTVTSIYDDVHDKKVALADQEPLEKKLEKPPPRGGYYIYGLTIESGSWNKRMKFMEDLPIHSQATTEAFPVIHLQIIENSSSLLYLRPLGSETTGARPAKPTRGLAQLILSEDTSSSTTHDLIDQKNNKYFLTPLYVTSERDGLPASLLPRGLICHIPIRADNACPLSFWRKRGTALLCHALD